MEEHDDEIKGILKRIEQAVKSNRLNAKEVFNIEDLCEYTGFSKSQVYTLTSKNRIPFSRPSGKVIFFKKDQIIDWLNSDSK